VPSGAFTTVAWTEADAVASGLTTYPGEDYLRIAAQAAQIGSQ